MMSLPLNHLSYFQLKGEICAGLYGFSLFQFWPTIEKIEKIESNDWLITTSVSKSIQAKCIVIAAGAGSFVPRKLPINDIEYLEEKNILYAVRNKSILEGKKLLIVGGGDSALDWTNELSKLPM